MKNYALLVLLFIFSYCGNNGYDLKIDNELNDEYKAVEGTKVSLIPPPNFTPSTTFSGFEEDSTGSSIMVTTDVGSYYQNKLEFTEAEFLKRDMKMLGQKTVLLNGKDAMLYKFAQEIRKLKYNKFLLMFGDSTETTSIVATYPMAKDKEYHDIMKKAVLSAFYDKNRAINPELTVNFRISGIKEKLKFSHCSNGNLTYTADGNPEPQGNDKSFFVIGLSQEILSMDNHRIVSFTKMEELARKLKQNLKVERMDSINIDSLDGYEIVAKFDTLGTKLLFYQATLFSKQGCYIAIAGTNVNHDDMLALFRKTIYSFKRKR